MTDEEYQQQQLEHQQYNAKFAGNVWQTLSAVNVNNHTENKGGFTYLSWCWAWSTLMENYPASRYDFLPSEVHPDSTYTVWVDLTVSDGENAIQRRMWLPVLDFKNQPIANPNAMQIQNTRMRCLVKSMAMAGLGSYLYAGEDLPQIEKNRPYTPDQLKAFNTLVASPTDENNYALFCMSQDLGQEAFGSMVATIQADEGKRNKTKKHDELWARIDGITQPLAEYITLISDFTADVNDSAIAELVAELKDEPEHSKKYIWKRLSEAEKEAFNRNTTKEAA